MTALPNRAAMQDALELIIDAIDQTVSNTGQPDRILTTHGVIEGPMAAEIVETIQALRELAVTGLGGHDLFTRPIIAERAARCAGLERR